MMRFEIESVHLGEVKVVRPVVQGDRRGWFMESYRADSFRELGLPDRFDQDNHSRSSGGVVRGLHFQWDPPMGKLMRVSHGRAFVVAVDIRRGSPTFGKWVGFRLSGDNFRQLWIPPGFAHGFCVTSERVHVEYKCTGFYDKADEIAIAWNDPEIGIEWPMTSPTLSAKDNAAPRLAELFERLPA